MPPVQFAIQSYQSRALPLSAQQLVNFYVAAAPQDAKSPVVLHGTPGIKTFCDNLGDGPIRGMHVMEGVLYVMSGCTLYQVDDRCNAFPVGSIFKGGAGEPGVCMGAVANFRVTAGSEGADNQITSIKVNGNEILSATVAWTTSDIVTERLIATEITTPTAYLPGAIYTGNSFDTLLLSTITEGFFKDDGTKFFTKDSISNDVDLAEWTMDPPWDIAGATKTYTYVAPAFGTRKHTHARQLFFGGTTPGTRLYLHDAGQHNPGGGSNNDESIVQYSLTTPYDLSTIDHSSAVFLGIFDLTGNGSLGAFFRADGLKFFVVEFGASDFVHPFTMSSAWDLSTATYDGTSLSAPGANDVWFTDDGLQMYISDSFTVDNIIRRYTLATAWDVTTAVDSGKSLELAGFLSPGDDIMGLWVKPDQTRIYMWGDDGIVYEFDTTVDRTTTWQGKAFDVGMQILAPAETGDAFAGSTVEITTSGDVQVDNPTPPMGGGFCMPGNDC